MTTVPATVRETPPLALEGADEAGEAEEAAFSFVLEGLVESAAAALPEVAEPEAAVAEARPAAEPPSDFCLLLAASEPWGVMYVRIG